MIVGILARDTGFEAERIQVAIWQAMSRPKKAAVLSGLLRAGLGTKMGKTSNDVTDPYDILAEVIAVLDRLQIDYFIGGSIASALHGEPRYTQDADVVVRLPASAVSPLLTALQSQFYTSEDALRDAIRRKSSSNLIHYDTGFKVDLMISRERPFERSRFERRTRLPAGLHQFWVATAEDMVLVKLEWFRLGGEVSDKQWRDVLALLLTSATDLSYLNQWAGELQLADLLEKALREVRSA